MASILVIKISVHKLQVPLFYRSDQQFAVNAAAANNISYARPVFDSLDWTEDNSREFERIGQTGQQTHICISATEVSIIDKLTYVLHTYACMFVCT